MRAHNSISTIYGPITYNSFFCFFLFFFYFSSKRFDLRKIHVYWGVWIWKKKRWKLKGKSIAEKTSFVRGFAFRSTNSITNSKCHCATRLLQLFYWDIHTHTLNAEIVECIRENHIQFFVMSLLSMKFVRDRKRWFFFVLKNLATVISYFIFLMLTCSHNNMLMMMKKARTTILRNDHICRMRAQILQRMKKEKNAHTFLRPCVEKAKNMIETNQ